jgi:hypothetical protein
VLVHAGLVVASLAATRATQAAQELWIVERWHTKGDPAVIEFGWVVGIAETARSTIWVADPINKAIVELDSAGKVLGIVAREGDGPGEVKSPFLLAAAPSGQLAVYDAGRNSVELFGPDGRFLRRAMLRARMINPKGFMVTGDGHFVLSGGAHGRRHAIYSFDPGGRLAASWYPIPETRNERAGVMVAGGPLAFLRDGSILFSQAAPHRILRFERGDTVGRVIVSDPRILDPIGDDFIREEGSGANLRRTFRWYFPQSRLVAVIRPNRVLNVIEFYDEGKSLWEVYDMEGRSIARTEVGRAYRARSVTANGDILASYEDPATGEHIVARIAVHVQEPS